MEVCKKPGFPVHDLAKSTRQQTCLDRATPSCSGGSRSSLATVGDFSQHIQGMCCCISTSQLRALSMLNEEFQET